MSSRLSDELTKMGARPLRVSCSDEGLGQADHPRSSATLDEQWGELEEPSAPSSLDDEVMTENPCLSVDWQPTS